MSSTGPAIGIAVGIFAAILILGGVLYYFLWYKRRQQKAQRAPAPPQNLAPVRRAAGNTANARPVLVLDSEQDPPQRALPQLYNMSQGSTAEELYEHLDNTSRTASMRYVPVEKNNLPRNTPLFVQTKVRSLFAVRTAGGDIN